MPSFFRRRKSPSQVRRSPVSNPWASQKKGAGSSRREKAQWRQRLQGIALFIVAVVGVGLIGLSGWGLYSLATNVKTDKGAAPTSRLGAWWQQIASQFTFSAAGEKETQPSTVQGLSYKIPIFPDSTFVFAEAIAHPQTTGISEIDWQAIYQFLSNNQSVYLLPDESSFDQAVAFYQDALPKQGWRFVQTVPPGDLNRLAGAYFVNDQDKRGLRVYSLANDLWYETVTPAEANEALANRVGDLQTRQIEARSLTGGRVDAKVGWLLNFPNDWQPYLSDNAFFGVTNVIFKHKASDSSITIEPAGRLYKPVVDVQSVDLQTMAGSFFQKLLKERQIALSVAQFTEQQVTVNQAKAVRYFYTQGDQRTDFLFFIHKERQMVYVMYTIKATETELFNYWAGNMQEL